MSTFPKDHIIPELNSADAFQAIDELTDKLVSAGAIAAKAKEPIVAAVKQRERSMSTGIGSGVAIPHAAAPGINEVLLAFGRSSKGIEFNALDQQPVKLVVLILVPAKEREKHLPTIARVSRLLHRKDVRDALIAAKDADAIATVLNANSIAST